MKRRNIRIAGKLIERLYEVVATLVRHPFYLIRTVLILPEFCRGLSIADKWPIAKTAENPDLLSSNPLRRYFEEHQTGPGIWKWLHYFDAYHRHFARFRGSSVNVLEIGIYSGGSLPMWLEYFGKDCRVFGIDIESACKAYESERVQVTVGDQEDRRFWKKFRENNPEIHILVDDGGHTPKQQMVTLEEMLPYMPAGSVYMCEDIHGNLNEFAAFATALVHRLNAMQSDGRSGIPASSVQRSLHSIHFYPYLLVIEKHAFPPERLRAPKHGTEWQPFL